MFRNHARIQFKYFSSEISVPILITVVLFFTLKLAAGEWYVDPKLPVSGDGSKINPFNTVNEAINSANAEVEAAVLAGEKGEHIINLFGGFYPPLDAHILGAPDNQMILQSYGDEPAVFDGGYKDPFLAFREAPNDEWELVDDCTGEYRSRRTFAEFDGGREDNVWGQLMNNKTRLLTYNRIEDLRANNESFLKLDFDVPDTRPNGGRLLDGGNLLENPDFEDGNDNWEFLDGGRVEAGDVQNGHYALVLTGSPIEQVVVQRFEVNPNLTYNISGWMKTVSLTRPAKFLYRFLDSDLNTIGTFIIKELSGTNNYTQFGKVIETPIENANFIEVELSLERGAMGEVYFDNLEIFRVINKKYPWTYFGPGIFWNPSTKKIHIRLAHTHFDVPDITDYKGENDPNKVRLSISAKDDYAAWIVVRHAEFRNITFQNGGTVTLRISETSNNSIFDHCIVYASRRGVHIGPGTKNIIFRHSIFDGGLASWTTRTELKENYKFVDERETTQSPGLARVTNDVLLYCELEEDLKIHNCEFRRSHDGIYLWGQNVDFHHNLIEDINDEGLYLGGNEYSRDVKIYQNYIRQTLSPFSAANPTRISGTKYIYRNIVDQRQPTRNQRILRPDVLEPVIWNWGEDIKMNKPIGPIYYFQNTNIISHATGHAYSSFFENIFMDDLYDRHYFNNINVVICSNDNYHAFIAHPDFPAKSDGNLYYKYFEGGSHPDYRHNSYRSESAGSITDFTELHIHTVFGTDPSGNSWEASSIKADPKFRIFQSLCIDFLDTDFRLSGDSPAIGAGVILPVFLRLLDPQAPSPPTRPDIGALPSDSGPFTVGVNGRIKLPHSEIE